MSDGKKAIMLIENCITLVRSKQSDTKWMVSVDLDSKKLLDTLLNDLSKMKVVLNPKAYMPIYPRLIIEYWDEFSDIGNELLKASQEYEKLI
jgi:hypothetical protein